MRNYRKYFPYCYTVLTRPFLWHLFTKYYKVWGQDYLFYFPIRFPGVQKPLDQYGHSQSGTVTVKTSGDDEDEDDDFELFGDDDEVSNI